jgi:hypothetical protein
VKTIPNSSPPIRANAPIRVEALNKNQPPVGGRVVGLSGDRLELVLEAPLAAGEAVKIEAPDCLLLGEVLYCEAQPAPEAELWIVSAGVEHGLWDLERIGWFQH